MKNLKWWKLMIYVVLFLLGFLDTSFAEEEKWRNKGTWGDVAFVAVLTALPVFLVGVVGPIMQYLCNS